MDETLFYVESPDGQVLGPMSMMHILEGVAAGAILEDARICEVGQSEWIELADVAYSREVEQPNAALEAPRLDDAVVRGSRPADAAPVDELPDPSMRELVVDDSGSEGDPVWAAEIEGALAALESEALGHGAAEAPESIDRTDFPAPELTGLPDTWSSSAEHPAPPAHPTARPEPPAYAPPAYAADPEPEPVYEEPVYEESAPIGARAEEAFEASEETVVVHEAPAAPVSEASPEFALRMEHADAGSDAAPERARRRTPIPVPALVAIGLAVLGGAYIVGSGMFKKQTASAPVAPADSAAVATTADDPVQAAWNEVSAGRAAKAIPLFEAVLEAQPDDARAHHGLGVAALDTRKLDLAAVHLEKAVELADGDARVHLDLGRVRLAQGRAELAVQEAERARALDGAETGALLLLGRAHAAAKRPDDAVKALAAFVEASPKNVEARKDLAQALAAAGRVAPAVDEMGAYLQAHPEDRDMQLVRLDWMLAIGRGVAAAKLYPDDAKDDAFAQYLAGAARTGTEEGVACLRRATELDPKHRDAWVRLANAQAAIGRTKDAAGSMQRAFALAPATSTEKRLADKWNAAPAREPAVASAKPAPSPVTASVTPAPVIPDPAPAPAPAPKAAAVVPLADRVEDIRRALARADFAGARRTSETGRAELGGSEAARNLDLWNAIIDFEEGRLAEAQTGFESLDADGSYLGFGKGAVNNWLGRVLLVRGQARAAIGAFDQVPAEDPNEYAAAQLWQGVAMSALGMQDLASRTWARIRDDVGGRVGAGGKAALRSADFLSGAIAEKEYRTALSSSAEFENDMHFFLGWATRTDAETARSHYRDAVQASRGREFPYHLAEAEMAGGIAK